MRPSADGDRPCPALGPILRALRVDRFERVGEVPAVPADGRGRVRYPHRTEVVRALGDAEAGQRGEPWSLRSFGTDFDLLLRGWPRLGMSRVYSLGWGLASGAQHQRLLLVQAVGDAAELAGLARAVAPPADAPVRWAAAVGDFHGRPCLRAAAVPATGGPGDGGHA
ncbi:hypothetical protein RM844_11055 [Streptomyces sp. DSM 44915]|uniref:Uncharacterized protein n=1 Tax=Streptomyces chisholmiae TaxID=3075540 RepID=A0ABU2JQ27_9ACTN|nr:hypothetical protein [Streptomyces sp. DSM 44915]MDT0266829.1 hypothetical protein [Streptomyces sp. DSM 44915]